MRERLFPLKDATLYVRQLAYLWPRFSPEVRQTITLLREQSVQDVCRTTLSGPEEVYTTPHFAIHYTTTGQDAVPAADEDASGVPDYVETVAAAMERAWQVQVDQLGWTAPPLAPGETRYRVYLLNFLYFGVTCVETLIGDNPNSPGRVERSAAISHMALENDYAGFGGDPLAFIRVTAAHEFNHALQFGYDASEDPIAAAWLYEGVATWVEDEVFDDINDNRRYLKTFLQRPDLCLSHYTNTEPTRIYGTWIFFRYLSEHVAGPETVRAVWEEAVRVDNFAAVEAALNRYNRTLPDVFADFAVALALQRPCNNAEDPYCFEEAPFDTPTRLEMSLVWQGTPIAAYPSTGVQPLGVDFWRLQRAAGTPVRLEVAFEGAGDYRARLVTGDAPPTVYEFAGSEMTATLTLTDSADVPDWLAILRVDVPPGASCAYGMYRLSATAAQITPTPTGSPSPTPTPSPTPSPTPTPTPTATPTSTPTPTPTPTATPVPLPTPICYEVIQNGDFEAASPDPWQESPAGVIYSQAEGAQARSGTRSAWFGGYANAHDWLYQEVTLPYNVDSLTLTFWVYLQGGASDRPRHFLRVRWQQPDGTPVYTVADFHNLSQPQFTWFPVQVDITGLRGRTLRLSFEGETDETWSNFFVDDVSVQACRRPALVQNGGFETGLDGWHTGGDQPVTVVTDTVHTGAQALRLGEPVSPTVQVTHSAWISQTVVIPAQMAQPTLRYWYRFVTNDVEGYNAFVVEVWDAASRRRLATLADVGYPGTIAPPPATDLGWQEGIHDMRPFQGRRVTLRFANVNKWPTISLGSWTYLDDVRLVDAVRRGEMRTWLPFLVADHLTPLARPRSTPGGSVPLRGKPSNF